MILQPFAKMTREASRQEQIKRAKALKEAREKQEEKKKEKCTREPEPGEWVYKRTTDPEEAKEGKGAKLYNGPYQVKEKVTTRLTTGRKVFRWGVRDNKN